MIGWMLFRLVVGGSQIVSAILLLRERHVGPRVMLCGGILSLIAGLGHSVLMSGLTPQKTIRFIEVGSYVSALGMLLFAAGLLLFALHRRGQSARIAELEMILSARDAR